MQQMQERNMTITRTMCVRLGAALALCCASIVTAAAPGGTPPTTAPPAAATPGNRPATPQSNGTAGARPGCATGQTNIGGASQTLQLPGGNGAPVMSNGSSGSTGATPRC